MESSGLVVYLVHAVLLKFSSSFRRSLTCNWLTLIDFLLVRCSGSGEERTAKGSYWYIVCDWVLFFPVEAFFLLRASDIYQYSSWKKNDFVARCYVFVGEALVPVHTKTDQCQAQILRNVEVFSCNGIVLLQHPQKKDMSTACTGFPSLDPTFAVFLGLKIFVSFSVKKLVT